MVDDPTSPGDDLNRFALLTSIYDVRKALAVAEARAPQFADLVAWKTSIDNTPEEEDLTKIADEAVAEYFDNFQLKKMHDFVVNGATHQVSLLDVYLWSAKFVPPGARRSGHVAPPLHRLELMRAFAAHCGVTFPTVPGDMSRCVTVLNVAEENKTLPRNARSAQPLLHVADTTADALDTWLAATKFRYKHRGVALSTTPDDLLADDDADSAARFREGLLSERGQSLPNLRASVARDAADATPCADAAAAAPGASPLVADAATDAAVGAARPTLVYSLSSDSDNDSGTRAPSPEARAPIITLTEAQAENLPDELVFRLAAAIPYLKDLREWTATATGRKLVAGIADEVLAEVFAGYAVPARIVGERREQLWAAAGLRPSGTQGLLSGLRHHLGSNDLRRIAWSCAGGGGVWTWTFRDTLSTAAVVSLGATGSRVTFATNVLATVKTIRAEGSGWRNVPFLKSHVMEMAATAAGPRFPLTENMDKDTRFVLRHCAEPRRAGWNDEHWWWTLKPDHTPLAVLLAAPLAALANSTDSEARRRAAAITEALKLADAAAGDRTPFVASKTVQRNLRSRLTLTSFTPELQWPPWNYATTTTQRRRT